MRIRLLSISTRKSVVEFLVLLSTLAFQLSIAGLSVRTEVRPVMYFHFNRPVLNPDQTKPVATCIGPFHIGKNLKSPCGYYYSNASYCINCYTHGCSEFSRSTNVTKHLNVPKGNVNLENVLGTNGTLYLDLGVLSCSLIAPHFLQKYAKPCEVRERPNDANSLCQYRSETEPYVAITRTTYPITLPTTPTTGPPNVSYSPQPNFSLTTQLHRIFPTNVGFPGHENNSATNLGEGNRNQESNHVIVWISLAAAAIVFTLVGCGILFTQRSKIMKCLGSKSNRDILDNAFLYRDMSTSRRENQVAPQNAHYENIIPIVFHNETIYAELDLTPNNVNQEGEAVGANFPPRQSHDIVNQVNSVIYAELQKY
ncbi:hypothetical protein OUZ56_022370 [Daphnia magna]|uniref:Uncharacterized protein n=2 Tax=Daphnia magna TaxID=35525 RepID=A0ABR0AW59_9CRUS|nr:hypothetical protein OUZ56_022370 [Daphnia magna]